MKKYLFLIIGFLFNLAAVSGYTAVDKGVITGKVVEEVGALPIPSAVVAVYETGSERPFVTTATDENGFFKFEALKYGTYKVKVSFVGFASLSVNEVILTEKNAERNLGTLKLGSDQNNLSEVTITAEKPVIEFAADQITYNVDKSILAEGSTATDILKNVPMVQVDIDGNATISGKRSTRIFIDGKPSDYMTSNIADLLNVLPSDAIEKIEVMTNPPARYSGDGEGIINIVMKKGFAIGFNGNAGITAGLQGNTNMNTNAAYRSKNYSLTGGAAYRSNIGRSTSHSYRENFDLVKDTTFYYDNYSNSKSNNNGGNFRAGLDWDISPQQNLRVSTNFNTNENSSRAGTDFNFLSEELALRRVRNQLSTSGGNSHNFVFNTDYSLKATESGAKLSLGLTYNNSANDYLRLLDQHYTLPVTARPSLRENTTGIGNEGLTINLDYDRPVFKKRDQLEAGLMYNYRKNNNDMLVRDFDFDAQQYEIAEKLSNEFLYNERILAGYASYNYRAKAIGVKTGLRAELTDMDFDLSTGDSYNIKPYLSLFPTIAINRFFKKRYNIGATYSVRINRPRENTLNPQINDNDTLNVSYGNPDLIPAYTHQMDISFGAFGEKWSFTPRLSYSTSSGVIERYRAVSVVNGVAKSETTYYNVGSNDIFGLVLIGNYRPNKKLSTNANLTLTQSNYKSALNSALNRKGLSLRSAFGLSMQLPLKTAFEANVNYANDVNAQGRTKGSITSSMAARKMFLKNRLYARVSISDPFGKRNYTLFSEGSNFRLQSYSANNTSNVSLSLNYRFTKIRKVPPPPKAN
ncbi:outer membrane beta-barrel protein [Pedobacter heparinus]|uniref:outer membrane beta-barrel protein n=1 Tax=Pedobacter heparinus TaxID=984 RepID=UPI00292CE8E4|nr:outer membrane beta-barrel protein [Pedobacter heparinus]